AFASLQRHLGKPSLRETVVRSGEDVTTSLEVDQHAKVPILERETVVKTAGKIGYPISYNGKSICHNRATVIKEYRAALRIQLLYPACDRTERMTDHVLDPNVPASRLFDQQFRASFNEGNHFIGVLGKVQRNIPVESSCDGLSSDQHLDTFVGHFSKVDGSRAKSTGLGDRSIQDVFCGLLAVVRDVQTNSAVQESQVYTQFKFISRERHQVLIGNKSVLATGGGERCDGCPNVRRTTNRGIRQVRIVRANGCISNPSPACSQFSE